MQESLDFSPRKYKSQTTLYLTKIIKTPILVDCLIAVCIGVIAMSFNTYLSGTTSIWFDEAWSYGLSNEPLHSMFLYIWGPFQNMALYYVFLHYWLALLKILHILPNEFLLRLPSAIFATIGTILLYFLGKQYFGRTVGLIATGFVILNNLQLYGAQQARAYSLQMMLLVIGWYSFFALFHQSQRKRENIWWSIYIVVMVLSVYAHLFSVLVWIAQISVYFILVIFPNSWQIKASQMFKKMLLSTALIGILIFPIIYDAMKNGGESTWIPVPLLTDLYYGFLLPSVNSSFLMLLLFVTLSILGISVAILGLFPWFHHFMQTQQAYQKETVSKGVIDIDETLKRPALQTVDLHYMDSSKPIRKNTSLFPKLLCQPLSGLIFVLSWFFIPIILSFILTQNLPHPLHNFHLFYRRYLMVVIPPMGLMMGIGASSLQPKVLRGALLALIVFVGALNVQGYYNSVQLQDFRTTSFWLEHHYQQGDGIACFPVLACSIGIDYYLQVYPSSSGAHLDWDSPGIWHWPYYTAVYTNMQTLKAYVPEHKRVFLVYGPINLAPGSSDDVDFHNAQSWLGQHGKLLAQYSSKPVSVFLYEIGP